MISSWVVMGVSLKVSGQRSLKFQIQNFKSQISDFKFEIALSNSILFTLAAQGGNGYNVGTMKKSRGQLAAFAAALAAGLCVALTGCETSSPDETVVSISPEEATLTAANPSVTLTASGGWNYSWGCDENYG